MLPVKCNQHPWMKMYVNVVKNPWFAVTDEKGNYTIKDLPPGDYTLAFVHEKGTTEQKVTIGAKEDKKGVDALFKSAEEAWKKGDVNALADLCDFPVIMLSDDSKGEVKYFSTTREQWTGMMQQFVSGMPKDMPPPKHKQTPYFLSDDLAVAIEEHSMTGKMKGSWKAMSVLTLRDGKWKFKQMAEAGWGDLKPPAGATTAQAVPAKP